MERIIIFFVCALTVGLVLAGCKTSQSLSSAHETDWQSRVGAMSYYEVVQIYGAPKKTEILKDGRTRAEWIEKRVVDEGGLTTFDTSNPSNIRPVTESRPRMMTRHWVMFFDDKKILLSVE